MQILVETVYTAYKIVCKIYLAVKDVDSLNFDQLLIKSKLATKMYRLQTTQSFYSTSPLIWAVWLLFFIPFLVITNKVI